MACQETDSMISKKAFNIHWKDAVHTFHVMNERLFQIDPDLRKTEKNSPCHLKRLFVAAS